MDPATLMDCNNVEYRILLRGFDPGCRWLTEIEKSQFQKLHFIHHSKACIVIIVQCPVRDPNITKHFDNSTSLGEVAAPSHIVRYSYYYQMLFIKMSQKLLVEQSQLDVEEPHRVNDILNE